MYELHLKLLRLFAERLKTLNFRKLENFKKIPEMLGLDDEYPAGHPKAKC